MKIRPIPKHNGWYAFVAAFALIVVCLPFLEGAISNVSEPNHSPGVQILAWLFLILILCAAGFLVREFFMQLWHFVRRRSEPRYSKGKTPR